MAKARSLRTVKPGDKPVAPPKPPETIAEAAESSERDLLVSLRTLLANELDKGAVPAHALGTVTAKLREYDRDIRALDARQKQEDTRYGEASDGSFDASAI